MNDPTFLEAPTGAVYRIEVEHDPRRSQYDVRVYDNLGGMIGADYYKKTRDEAIEAAQVIIASSKRQEATQTLYTDTDGNLIDAARAATATDLLP